MEPQQNATSDQGLGGFRIKSLNVFFIVALAVLSVVLFVATMLLSAEYTKVTQIADEYHRVEEDAKLVQSASDDLTQDVQNFVMTGNRAYMDEYFTESNKTKRRELALEDLHHLEVDDTLLTLLERSVKESMSLMDLEYLAMRYAAAGYGIDVAGLPAAVQKTELPEDAQALTQAEMIEKAEELVFGDQYLGYKARISSHQQEFLDKASDLMEDLQEEGRTALRRLLIVQRVAILLIIFLGVLLFFVIARMIVHPLDVAVASISQGKLIAPVGGAYEIRFMSHAYNLFYDHNREVQKRLKQDAERDALTGVLNRRGYQNVIDKLSAETFPLALLVFDIDNFKGVNDTYGHEVGDQALKKLAGLLRSTFRTTDVTSRIGGDEFTVIVLNVTTENKQAIENKARAINEALKQPGPDKCPAMTVSVGCSFSPVGYNSYAFSQADAKMYEAKSAGGGIRFAAS